MLSDEQIEKLMELFLALDEEHQEQVIDALVIRYFESTGKFVNLEEEDE